MLYKTGPDPVTCPRLIDPAFPAEIALHSPYPNPFNSATVISYQLTVQNFVNLRVFDLNGREVETLVSGKVLAGSHKIAWNGEWLPAGIYVCRLAAGAEVRNAKMVLVK